MPTTAIETPITKNLLTDLGRLCLYPDATFHARLRTLLDVWPEVKESHRHLLAHCYMETVHTPLSELEQCYTATFEVSPRCVPYLSVYLFGQESFKRAEFMVGLLETYDRIGLEAGTELPDHLGLVLQALPALPREEQIELAHFCLRSPIQRMAALLAESSNPYSHLIALAARSVETLFPREVCHV